MQKVFISHSSALEFYRNARVNLNLDLENKNPFNNTLYLSSTKAQPLKDKSFVVGSLLKESLPYFGSPPLYLLTKNANPYRKSKFLKVHFTNQTYLKNSFLNYSHNIYISSPQLLFLQLAQYLTFENLLLTGLELCGTYTKSDASPDCYVYGIPPLTTSKQIKTYIKNARNKNKNIQGIQKALTVSSLLTDKIASFKEAELYVKLCAPRNHGGYGLTGFKANEQIVLSTQASEILKFRTLRPDLCNKKTKVAIEYDSNTFHDNSKQNEKDKIRAAALLHDGWTLFSIVPSQLHDVYSFNNLATKILKANKQDPRIRAKNFEIKRKRLWQNIYNN